MVETDDVLKRNQNDDKSSSSSASQTPTEIDDLSAADSDLVTQIDDDEPGEWAKAALSDFQDLDD